MFLSPKGSIHSLFYFLFPSSSSFPLTQLNFSAFLPTLKYLSSQSLTIPVSVHLTVRFFCHLSTQISSLQTAAPAFLVLDWLLMNSA